MDQYTTDKIDKVKEILSEIKVELASIKVDLRAHMKRSDLLEKHVSLLETDINKLRGFFTVLGYLLGIGATVLTILSQLKVF